MTGKLLIDGHADQPIPGLPAFTDARGDEIIPAYGKSGPQNGKSGSLTSRQIADLARIQVVTTQAGTAYTFVLADDYVRFTSADPVTATVPPNSEVAFPVGKSISIRQAGAGAVTVAAGVGVTVNAAGALDGQNATATLIKVATNEWDLCGKLA
jgi:hypothetical protein